MSHLHICILYDNVIYDNEYPPLRICPAWDSSVIDTDYVWICLCYQRDSWVTVSLQIGIHRHLKNKTKTDMKFIFAKSQFSYQIYTTVFIRGQTLHKLVYMQSWCNFSCQIKPSIKQRVVLLNVKRNLNINPVFIVSSTRWQVRSSFLLILIKNESQT